MNPANPSTQAAAVSRTIEVTTHGRYLVRPSVQADSSGMLVGFHGYKEDAETQLARLQAIPGAERFVLVSVQALHRFYLGRTARVVASWMTGQDRDLSIGDNERYAAAVLDEVAHEQRVEGPVVFAGFSQGVAMAFRAACASRRRVGGVVALGGDVPPELGPEALGRIPRVLLGQGERDEWYTGEKRAIDMQRLTEARVDVQAPILDAAHEWTDDFNRAAGVFLVRCV